MNSTIKILDQIKDFGSLKSEVIHLIRNYRNDSDQIMLQSEDNNSDWSSGSGSLRLLNKDERIFCNLNTELRGTLIETIVNKYNAYRSRIMFVPPRKCYSIHADPSYRIHIPIETNIMSYMVWPLDSIVYKFELGNVYWTDTKKMHTFFNGGTSERIHLVLCTDYIPNFDS